MRRKNSQKTTTIFSIFFLILTISFVANAAVIRVPLNYPTIQGAIDATVDGDTVLVSDGTYTGEGNKNLDFKGKAITVKSQNGPNRCIIDCENEGRGFCLHSDEEKDSVISGFTIKNGYADENSYFGRGGGIYSSCEGYDSSSCPTITNCIITENRADEHGGGIYYYSGDSASGTIKDCTIIGNQAGQDGAGIYFAFSDSTTTISNCMINQNLGAGMHLDKGGGIAFPTVTNCVINGNTGSGITKSDNWFINEIGNGAKIINCIINGNGDKGISSICDLDIENCVITENTGSGVYCRSGDSCNPPILTNCTISKNGNNGVSYEYGPMFGNPPTIINSIIWGNMVDEIHGNAFGDPLREADVSYSDIQGGYPGTGNIDANPLFVGNDDYHLTAGSPCIDAGTSLEALTYDLDGYPRPQGVGYDMGAYEYCENCDKRAPLVWTPLLLDDNLIRVQEETKKRVKKQKKVIPKGIEVIPPEYK